MNRIKWMRAKFPGSIRQIGKGLQLAKFGTDSDEGFVLDRVRDDSLEARYFERVSFQQTISDPFGNTFVIDRLDFRKVDFSLRKAFPELELRMAPRGIKGFVNGLMKASGFSMELQEHTVRLIDWIRAVERVRRVKVTIRGAVIAGIEVKGGARARVAISGPGDVRAGLSDLIPNKAYELETVQLDYPFGRTTQRLVLGSDSTIRFGANVPEDILEEVRQAFEQTETAN